jgi:hypothetical protein
MLTLHFEKRSFLGCQRAVSPRRLPFFEAMAEALRPDETVKELWLIAPTAFAPWPS